MAKQLILHIGSQNEDGDYYAALDGSKEVHVVSGDTIKELIEKKAADFTDNTILSGSLNNAKGIDVAIGSDSWHLVKKEVAKADDLADSAETEGTDSEKATETTDATADETTEDAEKVDESETETEEKWYAGDTEIALTDLSSAYSDLSGMSAEKILDTDWGNIFIAYYPLYNESGEVIGALGIQRQNQPVMRPSVLLSSGKMIPRQPYHLQSMTAASIWQKSTVRPENW